MYDRADKRKYRGEAGTRRTTPSSRHVRSRDTVSPLAATRTRTAQRQRTAERARSGRGRVRRPVTFAEILIWGAGAAVIGAFASLLYFQNWLIAGGVIIVVVGMFYWMRR